MDTKELIKFVRKIKNYGSLVDKMDSKKYEENLYEVINLLQRREMWEGF
ncbi:unnamed protein product, partial [marine sediment metagenome]